MKELRRVLYSLLCVCFLSTLIILKSNNKSSQSLTNESSNTIVKSNKVLLEKEYKTISQDLIKKINLHKQLKEQYLERKNKINIAISNNNSKELEDKIVNNIENNTKSDIKKEIKKENVAKTKDNSPITNIYFIAQNNNFIINSIQDKIEEKLNEKNINNELKVIKENIDLSLDNAKIIEKIKNDENDKILIPFSQSIYEYLIKNFQDSKVIIPLLLSTTDLKNNNKLELSKNILGVRTPIAHQAISNIIKKTFSNKQIIVLYNGLEQESLYNFQTLKETLEKQKIPYIRFSIKNQNDIDNLSIFKNDAKDSVVLLVTSNLFLNNYEKIKLDFEKIKMPIITLSELELKKFNGVLSLGVDYDTVANQTFEKIDILLNKKEVNANKRIELAKLYNLIVNIKHANKINITIPESVINDANKVIR